MTTSLFSFNYRLEPREGCLHLNFDQETLAPGFGVACTRDHLGIIWVGDPEENVAARATAYRLARNLVHADSFLSFPTGTVLNVAPVTWLEVQHSVPSAVVSGYMSDTLAAVPLDPNHADGARMRKAAALVRSFQTVSGAESVFALEFAFGDFYTARREVGPYSAFYAFRTLEDIGFHFGVKDDRPDWTAMNTALGTSKSKWDLLTEAGIAARHLNLHSMRKLEAIERFAVLRLAHEAIELTLQKVGLDPGPPQPA